MEMHETHCLESLVLHDSFIILNSSELKCMLYLSVHCGLKRLQSVLYQIHARCI
jgi:hypothetical protein